MEPYEKIEGFDKVVQVFGYWPSFHDAEILIFNLSRSSGSDDGYNSPAIEFVVHGWEMTSEVTSGGFYKLQKHHIVHFRFYDIFDLEIEGFNHQNAIMSLEIELLPENENGVSNLYIVLDPAYGLGAEFKSSKGEVLSIVACDENGNVS